MATNLPIPMIAGKTLCPRKHSDGTCDETTVQVVEEILLRIVHDFVERGEHHEHHLHPGEGEALRHECNEQGSLNGAVHQRVRLRKVWRGAQQQKVKQPQAGKSQRRSVVARNHLLLTPLGFLHLEPVVEVGKPVDEHAECAALDWVESLHVAVSVSDVRQECCSHCVTVETEDVRLDHRFVLVADAKAVRHELVTIAKVQNTVVLQQSGHQKASRANCAGCICIVSNARHALAQVGCLQLYCQKVTRQANVQGRKFPQHRVKMEIHRILATSWQVASEFDPRFLKDKVFWLIKRCTDHQFSCHNVRLAAPGVRMNLEHVLAS